MIVYLFITCTRRSSRDYPCQRFSINAGINSAVRTLIHCAVPARRVRTQSFENSLATPLLCVRRSRSRLHLAAGILSSHSRVTDIPSVLSVACHSVAVALRRANAFLNLSLSPSSVGPSCRPARSLIRSLPPSQSADTSVV